MRDSIRIALFGEYETRKTLQAGYLIDAFGPRNVFILSADKGLSTIRSRLGDNYLNVESLQEVRQAFTEIRDGKLKSYNRKGAWVILDGCSRMFQWIENEAMRAAEDVLVKILTSKENDIPPAQRRFQAAITERDRIDPQKVYGFIGRGIEDFINTWMRLDCNLYANFLEALAGRRGRERTFPYGPDIPGQMGYKAVMSSFDFIFRVGFENGKYQCWTGGNDLYEGRRRNDVTGGEIIQDVYENFNLAEFAKTIGCVPPAEETA